MNIYFHIDEFNRDAVVASALKAMAKTKGWRVVLGNRQLGLLLPKFEKYFDIVVLPKPTFFKSFFELESVPFLESNYVMLYTEQIGIMTSKDFPQLALRQMLDKEFMSGDSRCVDKVAAFCFWSNQAKRIVTDYFPDLSTRSHVVGHPRHDSHSNPILRKSEYSRNNEIGILTRAVLLNDYFGRNPLENIFENLNNVRRGGIVEYQNNTDGSQFISQIRGVNPKNDIFLEAIDFENMSLLIEEFRKRNYKINLKLHPKEDSSLYRKLFGGPSPSLSIAPSNQPFANWVQGQKFLIGPPSTSFYDAYLSGVLPISTSELNQERKRFVSAMYEDNNQLMKYVHKPKSISELLDFVENLTEEKYTEMVERPEVLEVLGEEVNFPFHRESLNKLINIFENLHDEKRPSFKRRFGILRFILSANLISEIRFPYFLIKQKLFSVELLNSANFVMNTHNRKKIKRLIHQLDSQPGF